MGDLPCRVPPHPLPSGLHLELVHPMRCSARHLGDAQMVYVGNDPQEMAQTAEAECPDALAARKVVWVLGRWLRVCGLAEAHQTGDVVALAATDVVAGLGAVAETVGRHAGEDVGKVPVQHADPSAKATSRDALAVGGAGAAGLHTCASHPDGAGWVALEAAAVACDHVGRTDSLAEAASVGFAVQLDDLRSSCCRRQVAVVQAQAAGFVRVRPIADRAGHPRRLAGTLEGGRLAVRASRPDWAGRWLADPSAEPGGP